MPEAEKLKEVGWERWWLGRRYLLIGCEQGGLISVDVGPETVA